MDFAPKLKAGQVVFRHRYFRNKRGEIRRTAHVRYFVSGALRHLHFLEPLDLSEVGWHEIRPESDDGT